ncbi:MAG: hypothetical protein P8J59_10460 [Phycisphaerales bacterium]|jgi:hypothetical protein|nr:hypothetical protein [Phycisphaerales bacterium]
MHRIDIPKGWRLVDERDSSEFPVLETESDDSIPFPPLEMNSSGIDVEEVLRAADEASRRMEVLARELDCLGLFDQGDDGPRAA